MAQKDKVPQIDLGQGSWAGQGLVGGALLRSTGDLEHCKPGLKDYS